MSSCLLLVISKTRPCRDLVFVDNDFLVYIEASACCILLLSTKRQIIFAREIDTFAGTMVILVSYVTNSQQLAEASRNLERTILRRNVWKNYMLFGHPDSTTSRVLEAPRDMYIQCSIEWRSRPCSYIPARDVSGLEALTPLIVHL